MAYYLAIKCTQCDRVNRIDDRTMEKIVGKPFPMVPTAWSCLACGSPCKTMLIDDPPLGKPVRI